MQKETPYYEMFSKAGDRACHSLVTSASKKILGKKRLTKQEVQELFDNGRKKISVKHGEVFDTEPRYHIARGFNNALKEAGYGFRFNSWGDLLEDC